MVTDSSTQKLRLQDQRLIEGGCMTNITFIKQIIHLLVSEF